MVLLFFRLFFHVTHCEKNVSICTIVKRWELGMLFFFHRVCFCSRLSFVGWDLFWLVELIFVTILRLVFVSMACDECFVTLALPGSTSRVVFWHAGRGKDSGPGRIPCV